MIKKVTIIREAKLYATNLRKMCKEYSSIAENIKNRQNKKYC